MVNIILHKYITINKQTAKAHQNFKKELSRSSDITELLIQTIIMMHYTNNMNSKTKTFSR